MSNPTSNFGWQMPTATDLVTDLPADFEVFGQAVDTALMDLKGGTTNQVLAKNSNTDMDFKWVADAAGMTNPMTTTGDIIYSSSGSTPARLGIGTTGQVLNVAAGVPAWTTPATGGGMTLLATTTLSGGTTTISSISGSYKDLLLIYRGVGCNGNKLNIRVNGITTSSYYGNSEEIDSGSPAGQSTWRAAQSSMEYRADYNQDSNNTGYLRIYDYANTGAAMKFMETKVYDQPADRYMNMNFVNYDLVSAALTSVTFFSAAGTISGTVLTYGVS